MKPFALSLSKGIFPIKVQRPSSARTGVFHVNPHGSPATQNDETSPQTSPHPSLSPIGSGWGKAVLTDAFKRLGARASRPRSQENPNAYPAGVVIAILFIAASACCIRAGALFII